MRTAPPDVTASWPLPNFDDPSLQGKALLVTQLALVPLALLALAVRLFVRVRVVKSWGWDDVLMLIAWIFSLGVSITVILAAEDYGWQMHVWDLTPARLTSGRKASIAAQTLFLFGTSAVKLSILSSYLRLALRGSWFRLLTWVAIGWVILTFVTFFTVLWTQCLPANHYWNDIDSDACVEEGPPLIAQTATGVLTDILIYLLPIPTLARVNIPRLQNFALILIFSLGLVVMGAACMRLRWVIKVTLYTYDVTWDGYQLWIWTAVEINLAVVCGCAPTCKCLVTRFCDSVKLRFRRQESDEIRMV